MWHALCLLKSCLNGSCDYWHSFERPKLRLLPPTPGSNIKRRMLSSEQSIGVHNYKISTHSCAWICWNSELAFVVFSSWPDGACLWLDTPVLDYDWMIERWRFPSQSSRSTFYDSFVGHCKAATRTHPLINMVALPEAVTSVIDQSIQFVYSLEPLVAPTLILGKKGFGWLFQH